MHATCQHLGQITDVGPGADVCQSCATIGGTWLFLRQCLVCGRTGCCDSSPNKHASAHFAETGHAIMRPLEEGNDWTWCFICKETMRQDPGGEWQVIDSFFEAGLWYAHQVLEDGTASVPFEPGATAAGFPLSVWETTYRDRRRSGTLDREKEAALEVLPGWRW
jgi:hypothetical protein